MRESLFRAAQSCKFDVLEETVGQYQSFQLTELLYEKSAIKIDDYICTPSRENTYRLIIWPYPATTGDCIDRANCADDFIRHNPSYRVITSFSTINRSSLCDIKENILLFDSFENIFPNLEFVNGYITYKNRACDIIINELSLGYLIRFGVIKKEIIENNELKTGIINSCSISLYKFEQMQIFSDLANVCGNEYIEVPKYFMAASLDSLWESLKREFQFDESRGYIIRPFSASQGTGVTIINVMEKESDQLNEFEMALEIMSKSYIKKYGNNYFFPLTCSSYIESIKMKGCVSDFRIFVVYDNNDKSLHAIPAMIRRAQSRLEKNDFLNIGNTITNLNAEIVNNAQEGARVFPITNSEILDEMGLSLTTVQNMCVTATTCWSNALSNTKYRIGNDKVFAYGSVDFLVAEKNKKIVPIEMNGANVGSHPAVHPRFLSKFANATSFAIERYGIGEEF